MSYSNVTNIRCMFAVPGINTYQGFNTVANWGWAKSEVDLSKEKKRVKNDLKEMERRFNKEVRFDGWDSVSSESEVLEKALELQNSYIDAVLVFMFADVTYSYAFLAFNKPIIFFIREYTEPFYGHNLNTTPERMLKRMGKQRWATVVWDSYDRLLEEIIAVHAMAKLRHTKVLCIGLPNPLKRLMWRAGSYEFIREAQEKLGVKVEFISLKELIKKFKELKITQISQEVRNLFEEFQGKAKTETGDVDEESALNAMKVYLLLRETVENKNASALTINCYTSNLIKEIDATPCFALSRLNDDGIVSACEGDLNALINMLMVSSVSFKPCFMADMVLNPNVNTIIAAHCSCPIKMRGFDSEGEPYIVTTHYESGKGITPQVILSEGKEVTVTLLSHDLNTMIVSRGVIKKSNMNYPICRTQVEIEIKSGKEFWDKSSELEGFTHMIIVYGDNVTKLKHLCRLLDIEFKPLL